MYFIKQVGGHVQEVRGRKRRQGNERYVDVVPGDRLIPAHGERKGKEYDKGQTGQPDFQVRMRKS